MLGMLAGTDTAPFLGQPSTPKVSALLSRLLRPAPCADHHSGIPTFTDVLTTSTSTSFVPIGTGQPNDDTPSHSHNPAVIAVSVSVGAIAVLSLILFVTMRRRRALRTRTQISPLQRQESFKEIRPYLGSKSDAHRASWAPDIDTDGPRSSIISTRQLVISNQVNRAREKVAELEEISSLLRFSFNSSLKTEIDKLQRQTMMSCLRPRQGKILSHPATRIPLGFRQARARNSAD
ncbi:hypothetical protein B0H13DRAFT_979748 [Mycena leptocephala]|nr:hypothetical protein B0H13DRAFT_979748 [Mycena leptocephala]